MNHGRSFTLCCTLRILFQQQSRLHCGNKLSYPLFASNCPLLHLKQGAGVLFHKWHDLPMTPNPGFVQQHTNVFSSSVAKAQNLLNSLASPLPGTIQYQAMWTQFLAQRNRQKVVLARPGSGPTTYKLEVRSCARRTRSGCESQLERHVMNRMCFIKLSKMTTSVIEYICTVRATESCQELKKKQHCQIIPAVYVAVGSRYQGLSTSKQKLRLGKCTAQQAIPPTAYCSAFLTRCALFR